MGYHLCLNKEYSSEDVLQCVKNAVSPKELMDFSITGLKYPEGIGFHSAVIKETEWGIWDELWFDNAKANLANIVRPRLTKTIKCAVNAGRRKAPKKRAVIERFFGILEEYGYHRLPSTTGSNSKDPRKRDPVNKAKMYKISIDHLQELTEVLIAIINLTPCSRNNYISPLDCMNQRVLKGMIPRYLEEEDRNDLAFMTLYAQRDVRGNLKSGKRPYINFKGVEYRNEILSMTPELIGTKLNLHVNIEDLRVIKAFLPDGSELGMLTASGKWGVSPHTLKIRKEINKLVVDKIIYLSSIDDPIEIYRKYLEQAAIENKSARNKCAAIKQKYKSSGTKSYNRGKVDDSYPNKETTNTDTSEDNNENNSKTKSKNNNDLNDFRHIFKTFY